MDKRFVWDQQVSGKTVGIIGGVMYVTGEWPRVTEYPVTNAQVSVANDRPLVMLRTQQYAECAILTPALARGLARILDAAADQAEKQTE